MLKRNFIATFVCKHFLEIFSAVIRKDKDRILLVPHFPQNPSQLVVVAWSTQLF
jgi:hypothetical protein